MNTLNQIAYKSQAVIVDIDVGVWSTVTRVEVIIGTFGKNGLTLAG